MVLLGKQKIIKDVDTMFDPQKIYPDITKKRFLCKCQFKSVQEAKHFEAIFTSIARQVFPDAELYINGSTLIIDTPNKEKTVKLAIMFNDAIPKMH